MRGTAGVVVVLISLVAAPGLALAHLDLQAPVSRYGPEVLKYGPCGVRGGERTENVSVFEPGATIEVRWNEYVDHPGHYRIAFDADGTDDFVDPATMMELYSNEAVLLDGIADGGPAVEDYSAIVTLPDVVCDNCTLQVIQVMYDKTPYETPGNDIYYQCADLVLREGAPADGGMPSGGRGGSAGAGGEMDPGGGSGGQDGGMPQNSPGGSADGGGCSAAPVIGPTSFWALLVLCFAAARVARVRGFTV